MSLLILIPCTLTALLLLHHLYTHLRHLSTAKSLNCQPAPLLYPYDPLGIRNLLIELNGMKTHTLSSTFISRKHEMSKKLNRDVKTFRIKYPPGETWYYTFEPENLKAVLASQFGDFQQPRYRIGAFEALLGGGIFSSNGAKWQHSRSLLRPQFERSQIADLSLFETHIQDLITAILSSTNTTTSTSQWTPKLNLQPLLERFTMDVATEFLFGESVHSQQTTSTTTTTNTSALFTREEMKTFVAAFFAAQKTTAMSLIFADLYWLPQRREFKSQCKIVHNFVDTYVQRRLGNSAGSEKKGKDKLGSENGDEGKQKEKYVVLDALIADIQDPTQLRSELLSILLAGSDTISSTLGFLFASLAQYPRIFTKLRGIIIEDFGAFEQPKEITLSGLKNCTYLQWCINEVLRMYPSVPVNFREAVRDTSLPTGGGPDGMARVFVPRGSLVAWELWTLQSSPSLWGPSAHQFIPERWDGRKFGFHYLPFNAGPRICIGQQFALAEVAYVVVRLLQRFDRVEGSGLGGEEERLPCEWKLVDKVAGGVNVRLRCAGR